jgi:hypothetical protein
MKNINAHITDVEFVALKQLSRASGIAVAELLRRAIDRYVLAPDVVQDPPQRGPQAGTVPSQQDVA